MIKVDTRPLQIPGGSRLISSHAPDISGPWLASSRRSLLLCSQKPMKKFGEYLDHFSNKLFATEGEQLYCEWGVYKKTRKGKSESYDKHCLRHTWVKDFMKGMPKPSFTGDGVIKKILTLGLITTRYFLRISPSRGGTTMHGQTFTTTLFSLVNDRGNSFTLGAVSRQLKQTELYNMIVHGHEGVVWIALQEIYVKHQIKEALKNPAKLV